MKTFTSCAAILLFSGAVLPAIAIADPEQPKAPEHQVVAIYFHRTERCPTCKRIGALSEEAIAKGFQKKVADHTVEFRFVDFQDKKNAKLTKAYGIKTPSLVLLNVFEGEVACAANLPKVWQLIGKPEVFRTYVHDGVTRYLKQSKQEAEAEADNSKDAKK
jgi:hypothetical protein